MAWHTERWFKVPVTESADFLALPWQARGLYRLLQSKLNPDGKVDLGSQGLPGLALLLTVSWEEIQPFADKLILSGFWRATKSGVIFDAGFVEAQRTVRPNPTNATNSVTEEKRGEEKEKKKRGRPPGDPRHNAVIDRFHDLWAELRGGKYIVQGRDARAVADLLKRVPDADLAEFDRRIRGALADPWFRNHGSLSHFCVNWSAFDNVVPFSRTAPTAVGFDPVTNMLQFSDGSTREAK
jgi:hypothetical protein